MLVFLTVAFIPFVAITFTIVYGYENLIALIFSDLMRQGVAIPPEITQRLLGVRVQYGIIILMLSAAVAIGSFVLGSIFGAPAANLLNLMRKIARGDMDVHFPKEGSDEMAQLGREIETTIDRFKSVRERDLSLSEAKSEFITITAHQLRTPLTGIRWSLDSLRKNEDLAPDTKKILDQAFGTTEQMIGLVGTLFDVIKIEEGRFGYSFHKTEIYPLLEKVTKDHQTFARSCAVQVELKEPDPADLPAAVFIDPDGISIVLANILSNAIKYTPSGGAVTISAANNHEKKQVDILVSDNGIGIDEADTPRIFTKFFRADNAKRMQPNGNGIGLFLVKSIVERHGGTISFASGASKGTTFTVSLPIREEFVPKHEEEFRKFFENV